MAAAPTAELARALRDGDPVGAAAHVARATGAATRIARLDELDEGSAGEADDTAAFGLACGA